MNNMHVTEPIIAGATEPDWSDWERWLRSHLEIQREVLTEGFGEALGLVSQSCVIGSARLNSSSQS